MTSKLEEVKAAYDDWGAAHADALDADAAADAAGDPAARNASYAAWDTACAARDVYYAKLKKVQEENPND